MKVYRFALIDGVTDALVMGTEVDEPDPKIDMEFWERFLEGDCYMVYHGDFEEVNDD